MRNQVLRVAATAAVASAVAFGTIGSAQAASSNSGDKTITFGWTAWSDAKFVTHLAKTVIEDKTDYTVKLKMAAIGVQYKGVAEGDLDGMLMSWLPDTHASYMKKLGDQMVDLGTLYKGAKLGLAVPDYVSKDKLNSWTDLQKKSVQKMIGGKIQGIDPGAGIMQLAKKGLSKYNLKGKVRLENASGAAMTAALKRAEQRHEPIVVTLWTPHWAFGKWNLRFLKDPKGAMGKAQHIDVQVREGFKKDYPKVAKVLSNMHFNLDNLQKYMYMARKTSEQKAIDKYIADNKSKVDGWFNDKMASNN